MARLRSASPQSAIINLTNSPFSQPLQEQPMSSPPSFETDPVAFAAYMDQLMEPIPSPIVAESLTKNNHSLDTTLSQPNPPTPMAPTKVKAVYMYNSLKCKANLQAKFDEIVVKTAVAEKALQGLKVCLATAKKNLLAMFDEPIDLTNFEDDDFITPPKKKSKSTK